VPFEEVYFESGTNIVLANLTFTQPTTLIVENANVTINGNLT
jgi:hypothetical protein